MDILIAARFHLLVQLGFAATAWLLITEAATKGDAPHSAEGLDDQFPEDCHLELVGTGKKVEQRERERERSVALGRRMLAY